MTIPGFVDPLVIVVSREEVASCNIEPALAALRRIMYNQQVALAFVERVDISFHGYDHDSRELHEVPEVRSYIAAIDEAFPYWLFFLSKRHLGLQCIIWCSLPPHVGPRTPAQQLAPYLDEILMSRWFPAMNQICEWVGYTEDQIETMSEHVVKYVTAGRFPLLTPRGA